MSRVIKFRAIPINRDKFEYGYLFYHDGEPGIFQAGRGSLVCIKGSEGQYTGLKDKNGIDIYEGDVLELYNRKHERLKTLYTCYWNEKQGGFFVKSIVPTEHETLSMPIAINGLFKEIEVIANIYQNPELLQS